VPDGSSSILERDRQARTLIVSAMVSVVYERGFAATSLAGICARAGVSRVELGEHFESREQCFLAVMQDGYLKARALIEKAFVQHENWRDGIRAAYVALLSFFEEEPRIAWVWLVESLAAGSWALERRERHIAALTEMIVARWPLPPGVYAHPLAASSAMSAAIAVVQRHLVERNPDPLLTLLGPLMGIALAPYLDGETVSAELRHTDELARRLLAERSPSRTGGASCVAVPERLRDRRAWRARQCLDYLLEHPGSSNRAIAGSIGIRSHTQISALLARLQAMGLLSKTAGRPGYPNAWMLSETGHEVAELIKCELSLSKRKSLASSVHVTDRETREPSTVTS
jgi:AcrR family transcriptional regulator